MYCISDEQVAYILDDIRRSGIELEDLQLNLLDHICCILEQELKEGDDFERFYKQTVQQFYKKELREIEEETIVLLTFKNFYAMKKVMIVSGVFSAAAFLAGSVFKIMHWPGAAFFLFLAIVVFSLLFLPFMFLLKTKEIKTQSGKWVLALGTLTGILYCMSTLFAIEHWAGRTALWLTTVSLSMLVFIPAYFFIGIRKPETRTNTILSTVMLVGATGLLFAMIALRPMDPHAEVYRYTYMQNERLLYSMQQRANAAGMTNTEEARLVQEMNNTCEQIKKMVPGREIQDGNNNVRVVVVEEEGLDATFGKGGAGAALLEGLKADIDKYNALKKNEAKKIPLAHSVLSALPDRVIGYTNLSLLASITQLQLYIANNESNMLVIK